MAMHRRRQRVSPGAAQAGYCPAPGKVPSPARAAGGSPLRAAVRPIAWSALVSSVVLSIAVGPAHAAPDTSPGDQVPNAGLRPVPDRPLQLPGTAAPAAVPGLSPLAQQVTSAQARLEQVGEQLKQLKLEHAKLFTNLALADREWRAASERLAKAQEQASAAAAEVYKATSGLPPHITSDLRNLSALSPVTGDDIPGDGAATELMHAQQEEHDKYQAYLAALKAKDTVSSRILDLEAEFKRLERDFLALRKRHADELTKIELEREKRDRAIGAQFIDNGSLNGYAANPLALKAVRVALDQLGDPYVWGAEGPNSFDCSGLVWYSYFHGAGYNLPRVSRDQYNATKSRTVSRTALLPGDLLFFATNPNDWTTVHHVGMYLGNGKMIHAPTTGDVVKISTVWWSEFFAATRVFPERVAGVGDGTAPSGGGNGHPTPSPKPPKTPPASKPTPPPTSPSTPPDTSPSTSPSTPPSTTPSTPSESPSPSPSASNSSGKSRNRRPARPRTAASHPSTRAVPVRKAPRRLLPTHPVRS
jgi:hypothetical protein